jgi:hypothetical protein
MDGRQFRPMFHYRRISPARREGDANREQRRAKLIAQIRALGGHVPEPPSADVSDIELQFLESVMAWETGKFSTHREWLARRGMVFAPPGALRGDLLGAELMRLVAALEQARVFLYHTDHLTDAELYAQLWHEVLAADAPDVARTIDDACHWDFADASAGEEQAWLMYYASEEERRDWLQESRNQQLPARRPRPFDRDRRLPKREYS